MKLKNMVLYATLAISLNSIYGSDAVLEESKEAASTTAHAAEPVSEDTLNISLSTEDGSHVCDALVFIYSTHLNVRFSNYTQRASQERLLAALTRVIKAGRPLLSGRPWLNVVCAK